MRFKIDFHNFLFNFDLSLFYKGGSVSEGYSNRTISGDYVTFLDYDHFKLEWLEDELNKVMEKFRLTHFLIFQSSENNFHAVNLERMRAGSYYKLLKNSSADPSFKYVPAHVGFRSWVLRSFDKGSKDAPKFLKILKHEVLYKAHLRPVSKAHFDYLIKSELIPKELKMPIYIYLKRYMDASHELYLTAYRCESKRLI